MVLQMTRRAILAIFLLSSLAGVASGQVISAPTGQSRYVIELAPEVTATCDARTVVDELAATYGGTVEPQSEAGRFVIDLLPARAELLRRDAQVATIAEAGRWKGDDPVPYQMATAT